MLTDMTMSGDRFFVATPVCLITSGKSGTRQVHAVLHEHLGHVQVHAVLERHVQAVRTVVARTATTCRACSRRR